MIRALSDALLIAGVALIIAAGCEARIVVERDCAPVQRSAEGGRP